MTYSDQKFTDLRSYNLSQIAAIQLIASAYGLNELEALNFWAESGLAELFSINHRNY